MKDFFLKNFKNLKLYLDEIDINFLDSLTNLIIKTSRNRKKVILCGNGGSAATSSHLAVDLTKNAGIRAINFNEADLITCFSNDYNYENWVKKSLEFYADKGDLLILISCSGDSKNLVNANKFANNNNINVVTLTGCKKNNTLNRQKNSLKFWLDSNNYNHIEIIHHLILLLVVDKVVKIKL